MKEYIKEYNENAYKNGQEPLKGEDCVEFVFDEVSRFNEELTDLENMALDKMYGRSVNAKDQNSLDHNTQSPVLPEGWGVVFGKNEP